MQGARTRSVESPWACQVILLARTEGRRGRRGMLLIVVRRSISTTLPTSLPTSCFKLPALLARTERRREHGVLLYSCADQCRSMRNTKRRSRLRLYVDVRGMPLHSGACQTSNSCSARILLPMATAALTNTRFLMMYCPSRVNTTGKSDQTK